MQDLQYILAGCFTWVFSGRQLRRYQVSCSRVYAMAVSGMRIYGLGFLFAGLNIFSAVRMIAYGKGHVSGVITFLRSFALLLLFLILLPLYLGMVVSDE